MRLPPARRPVPRAALVAVFGAVLGLGLAACSSGRTDRAATLLDAVRPDAAVVLHTTPDGLAGASSLLPGGAGALLTLVPRERLADLLVATDSAGATTVAVRVTGEAADFTGFLTATGETHRDARLFTLPGGVLPGGGASGATTLAVKGDLLVLAPAADDVRGALDRLAGKAPRLSSDRVATRLYARIVREPVGVLTTGGQIGGLLGGGTVGGGAGGIGDLLALVPLDRIALGLRLSGAGAAAVADGTLWLAPREGTPAETLASLLGLAVGAFRQQPGLDPATAALLKGLRFSADGGDVSTPIQIPLSALTGVPTLSAGR